MKAAVLYGPYDLRIEDIQVREPKSDEVLVRVHSSGICGSDINIYTDKSDQGTFPYVPGHEWSGEIARTGDSVTSLKIGDRVVGETVVGCGTCDVCKIGGNPNYCRSPTTYGFQPSAQGAFSEYVLRKETNLHKIPDVLTYDDGCLVEPLSVAYHAIWKIGGGLRPTDKVVIFGTGPIGLFALRIAKLGGAAVYCVDPVDARRRFAETLGADSVIDPMTIDPSHEILRLTKGIGASFVLETSGTDSMRSILPDVVDCMGQIVLVGISKVKKVPFELEKMISKGLTLKGAEGSPEMFPQTIDLLEKNRTDFSRVISHRFSLEKAGEAFGLASRRNESIKILLTM